MRGAYGMAEISLIKTESIIEAFKNSFFKFQNITFRAAPGIRQILKCDTRHNPPFRISFCRIINIMAFKADPAYKFFCFCHFRSDPSSLTNSI